MMYVSGIANTYRKYFEEYEEIRKFNEHNAAEKKRSYEKKASGPALASSDEESFQYIGRVQPFPVQGDYVLKKHLSWWLKMK